MLARETLEGVTRYGQGRLSKEMRPQRRLRFTLADETEAGGMLGAAIIGLDPTTNQLMPLATQLQIENRQTGKTDIFKPTTASSVESALVAFRLQSGLVLDPFAGSGTTLVAAHKAKRRGYGIEIDPAYCDLIVRRMADQFGLEALADGERPFAEIAAERLSTSNNENPK